MYLQSFVEVRYALDREAYGDQTKKQYDDAKICQALSGEEKVPILAKPIHLCNLENEEGKAGEVKAL